MTLTSLADNNRTSLDDGFTDEAKSIGIETVGVTAAIAAGATVNNLVGKKMKKGMAGKAVALASGVATAVITKRLANKLFKTTTV